jgi:hypothetical protein
MPISRTKLLSRATSFRDSRLCIIATEGAETEKRYFAMFENPRVRVRVLSTSEQGESAPQHVLNRLQEFRAQYELDQDDSLWLMIDVDRWLGPHGLPRVCKEAQHLGVKLAVSNPCFELWLLLHHADADEADRECKAVESRLQAKLGGYNKSNLQTDQFHMAINEAIERAKRLDNNPTELWPSFPGTHVHKVVMSLPPLATTDRSVQGQ